MKQELIKLELQEQHPHPKDTLLQELYTQLVKDMELECHIRVGTVNVTLEALQQLREGDVLSLLQGVDEPIELLLHNKVIARGELYISAEKYAMKISQIGDE
jgi:flagellar motor switch protein FliN/FliY